MEPRNVILWALLPVMVVLVMSAGVQAQELREVPASEILEKIQAGEDVNYTNVRVTGVLDIDTIDLERVLVARTKFEIWLLGLEAEELKTVESKIRIINSVFENDVDLSNIQFKETLNFQNTSFSGKTGFSGASFSGYAHFEGASFGSYAGFGFASFGDDADFDDVSFSGYADFWGASFSGYTDFEGANFGSFVALW